MQRVINEEAERRLVAAYINGLAGIVGQQVRFRMPHTLEEAVQVAVTVSNAEWMRAPDTRRVFSTKRDSSSQGITCFNCGKKGHYTRDCRLLRKNGTSMGNGHARNLAGGRGQAVPGQAPRNSSTGGNPSGKQIQCFHCKKLGHQCLQLMKNSIVPAPPNSYRSTTRSPKSMPGSQASQYITA